MSCQNFQFSGVAGSSFTACETSDVDTQDALWDCARSDSWRHLVAQVESSLCREERSRQALDQLQQLAAEQGANTQFLLKAIIRETIRLTMECLSEAKTRLSFTSSGQVEERVQPIQPIEKVVPVPTVQEKQAREDAAMVEALNHALKSAEVPSLLDRLRFGQTKPAKLSPEVLHQAGDRITHPRPSCSLPSRSYRAPQSRTRTEANPRRNLHWLAPSTGTRSRKNRSTPGRRLSARIFASIRKMSSPS